MAPMCKQTNIQTNSKKKINQWQKLSDGSAHRMRLWFGALVLAYTHTDTVDAGIKRFRFNLLCLLFEPNRCRSFYLCVIYTQDNQIVVAPVVDAVALSCC